MPISRYQIRVNIITCIYDNLIYEKNNLDYDVNKTLLNIFKVEKLEDLDLFTKQIYLSCYKNREEIIKLVQSKLVKWQFNRLNLLSQALFIEVVAEGKFENLTNKPILIDFAVDYAKKFLSSKDYKYINAVLDRIL